MRYYILSGMDAANNYQFYKKIGNFLRNELLEFNSIVYISAYPNSFEKNLKLSKSEIFNNIGLNFKKSIVLDYSFTKKQAKKIIEENNLIFLFGGDPYQQMLRDKVLITLSAGSINLCDNAICTKDNDFEETSKYKRYGIS